MALAEDNDDREAARLYVDCFKAFRIGIGLAIRLMEPPKAPRALAEREPAEPSDRAADREPRDDDRDRDRDDERVSFPAFLNSLRGVAREADAERLPPDAREDLAAIRRAVAAPPVTVLTRPAPTPASNARSRLLGSAAGPKFKPPNSS